MLRSQASSSGFACAWLRAFLAWTALFIGAAVLVGCGGGDAPAPLPPPAMASPAAAAMPMSVLPLRSAPAAAASITPDQLMDWAETTYPELFPTVGKTAGFLDPYTYRFYSTNNYIAVAPGAGEVDVYLYGVVTGWQLAKLGPISNFTCMVTPLACADRTLSISQFGEGTVLASDNAPVCTGQECSREYPYGTAVSMTATPGAGWKFRYWSGCDTTTTNHCSVTLGDNKTVHPVFERIAPPVLKSDAVLLTATTMSRLISNEGGVLIFRSTATQAKALTAGKVIYSTTGAGLLRRVTNVISLTGGNIIVDTTDATLVDLIAEGTVIIDGRKSTVAAITASGGDLQAFGGVSATATFDVKLVDSTGDGVTAKATIDLQPEIGLDFTFLGGLKELKFIVNPELKLSEVQVRLKEGLFTVEKKLATPVVFTPIIVPPLVLTPTLDIVGRAKGEIKVGVEMNGSLNAGGALGAHYRRSGGWDLVGNLHGGGAFNTQNVLTLKGSGELDGSLSLESGFKAFAVIGPAVIVGPFFNAKASLSSSRDEDCVRWTAKGGVRAKVKADAAILSWEIARWEATWGEISWVLLDGSALKCDDKEKPTQVPGGTVVAVTPTQLQVSWTAATDNIGVTGYAVTRNLKGRPDEASNSFLDTGLQPDTEYCYRVTPFDKAGNRAEGSPAFCGRTPATDTQPPGWPFGLTAFASSTTSIELQWAPGANSSDVRDYVIYMSGRQVAHTSNGSLSTIITKLRPNTNYCFTVAAIDTSGNVGPQGSEECVTTRGTAAWSMKIKCVGADIYVVENDVDLDVNSDQSVNVVGTGTDYGGGGLAYQLFGTYAAAQTSLTGRISWTFANSSNVRVDLFNVNVASGDTGDVTMTNQVMGLGSCITQIRFVRKTSATAALAMPKEVASPVWLGGSISGQ
jgi:chitodextrinase